MFFFFLIINFHQMQSERMVCESFHIKSARVDTHATNFLKRIAPLIVTYNVRKIPKFESLTPSGSRYTHFYSFIQIPLGGHYEFLFSLYEYSGRKLGSWLSIFFTEDNIFFTKKPSDSFLKSVFSQIWVYAH